MQEETTASSVTQQQQSAEINHQYYEVGREILSKPNLLCDIVESLEAYPALIYCNTPSDTDFVDVMLRKRGIQSQKLIGNVPQEKIDSTFDLINQGQISAVVLTDIAARLIDITPFKIAINYSVPQDVESYTERCGQGKSNALKNVVTLVTPLELANFHFLKKGLGISPEALQPPSQENILKARIATLKQQASTDEQANTEAILSVAKMVLADADKEKIVALLLHNTLNVLPTAKAASQKAYEPSEDEDFDSDDSQPDRWSSREGRGGGRSNRYGGRNNRGGDRGDRGDRDRGDRGDRGDNFRSRDRYDNDSEGEDRRGRRSYDDSQDDSDSQQGGQRGERRSRNGRQFDRQVKKDARIYLNKGSESGVSRENILEMLEKNGISADGLKHLSIRKSYSFFDIDDEKSNDIVEAIKSEDAEKTAVKAITINAVVPEQAESGNQEAETNQDAEGFGNNDFGAEDEGDNIGNR